VIASVAIVALSFNFYANAASNSKDEQAIREVENGMIAARLGALSYYRWFVPARNSSMEFARTDRKTLLTQATTNRGKPPDHDRPIHNIRQLLVPVRVLPQARPHAIRA
jgi:hypothetical protein